MDIGPRGVGVKQHGDVVIRLRVLRQVGEAVGPGAQGNQFRGVKFKQHHGQVLDAAVHGDLLGHQAHIADLLLAPENVQPYDVVRPHRLLLLAEGEALHVGIAGHILQDALGLPEELGHVLHAAGKGRADVASLLRQGLRLIVGGGVVPVEEHLGLLEDGKIVKIPLVLHHRLAEVGEQGGADVAQIRRRRHGEPQHSLRALENRVHEHIVHPRIGVDLLHAAADRQILLDAADQILISLVDGPLKGCGKGGCLKIVVAVHSGNLLHHVVLDGDVAGGTPGGGCHVHIVPVDGHLKAQKLQLLLNLLVGQILAQALGQPGQAHVDLRLLQGSHIPVAEARHLELRVQLVEILHGQGQSLIAALRVHGLLIPGGGLRAGVVAQSRPADAGGLKVCHLQDHPLGIRQNGVLGASHDAGQGHRALGVGDHQIVVAEGQLLLI